MEKLHAYEFGYSGKDEMIDEMVDLMNKVFETLDCKEVPLAKSELIEYYKDTIFHSTNDFVTNNFKADFVECGVIKCIGNAVMDYVNDSLDDTEKNYGGLRIDTDSKGNVTVTINGKCFDESKPREFFIPMGDDYIALKTRDIIDETVYDSKELRVMEQREDIDIDSYGENTLGENTIVVTSYKTDKSVEIPFKDIYNTAISHLPQDISYRSDELMIAISVAAKIAIIKAINDINKHQIKDFQVAHE